MPYTPAPSSGSSVVADPATPQNVDTGASSSGLSEKFARGDHHHHAAVDTPVALTPGAANAAGSSTSLSAADHVHALPGYGIAAGTIAQGNDSRIVGAVQTSRQITVGAGLTGGGTLASDVAVGVNFGTGATSICNGADSRLSNDRIASSLRIGSTVYSFTGTPAAGQYLNFLTASTIGPISLPSFVLPSRLISTSGGIQGGGDLSSDRSLSLVFGTFVNTVCQGNDTRLSDTRMPIGPAGGGLSGNYPSPSVIYGTSAASACVGNDSRLSDARVPTGAAGGGLTGTYPNPSVVYGTLAGTAAQGNDTRLSDARTPTGAAGGGLSGTYPNPAVIYGTSAASACVGNDSRLSDSRAPTGAAGGGLTGTYPSPTVVYGSSAGTAAQGNDARLSDARTPTGAASGQLSGTYPSPTVVGITSPSAALTIGAIADNQILMRSGTTIVGAAPGVTSAVEPISVPVTLGGSTAETAIASMRVPIPAGTMQIGHTVRWSAVLTQLNFVSGTVTLKVHYGPLGTVADPLVANLAFIASTNYVTYPQFLSVLHTVRGPLAAGCAAMTNALVMKGAASGIGGAFALATPNTMTMTTFTANPAVLNYWTLTYTMSVATLTYTLAQTLCEIAEW